MDKGVPRSLVSSDKILGKTHMARGGGAWLYPVKRICPGERCAAAGPRAGQAVSEEARHKAPGRMPYLRTCLKTQCIKNFQEDTNR